MDFSSLWTCLHIPPEYAFPSMVLTENSVSLPGPEKRRNAGGSTYREKLSWHSYKTVITQ